MWEIWANSLLQKALKSCPKCKKSPTLVTLIVNIRQHHGQFPKSVLGQSRRRLYHCTQLMDQRYLCLPLEGPGLVVMGDDSCLRGHGFESRSRIQYGHEIFYIDLLFVALGKAS